VAPHIDQLCTKTPTSTHVPEQLQPITSLPRPRFYFFSLSTSVNQPVEETRATTISTIAKELDSLKRIRVEHEAKARLDEAYVNQPKAPPQSTLEAQLESTPKEPIPPETV